MSSVANFSANYRVYYEDTDAGGVMYYANYLKFFERARTDFLRDLGVLQQELIETEQTAFVVRHCAIDYIKPARLDDFLTVALQLERVSAASLVMQQQMYREEVLLSVLKVEIVSVDIKDFRPKRIANHIRILLEK